MKNNFAWIAGWRHPSGVISLPAQSAVDIVVGVAPRPFAMSAPRRMRRRGFVWNKGTGAGMAAATSGWPATGNATAPVTPITRRAGKSVTAAGRSMAAVDRDGDGVPKRS
jgi:hypothetical protein